MLHQMVVLILTKDYQETGEHLLTTLLKNLVRLKLQKLMDFQLSYYPEDWEGFKTEVENSNMQDKDLILRVLSMYSDQKFVKER